MNYGLITSVRFYQLFLLYLICEVIGKSPVFFDFSSLVNSPIEISSITQGMILENGLDNVSLHKT